MHRESVSSHTEQETGTFTCNSIATTQDVIAAMQAIGASNKTLALVTISLRFAHKEKISSLNATRTASSVRYFLDNMRSLVRKTDIVLLVDHTLYFLLPGATLQGGAIVQERLWEGLLWRLHNTTDTHILHPHCMTIGHSAYPLPCNDMQHCITDAHKTKHRFDSFRKKSLRNPIVSASNQPRTSPISVDAPEQNELYGLSCKLGVPYLTLLPRTLPARLQQVLSPQLAQELRCYPLGQEQGTLTVAMSNPQDNRVLDRLRQETGLHIFPVLAHPHELQSVLELLASDHS